jgi:hypothetical protein
MVTDTNLNDGIFHPYYNKYGWRCRHKDGTNYTWDQDIDGENYIIDSAKKCFDISILYNGDNDELKYVSGRPDGKIVTTDADTVANISEW